MPPDLFPSQDAGEHQGEGEGHHCDHHDEQDGILHGGDKFGILKQGPEILQSHEGFRGGIGAPLKKGHAEYIQGGEDHKEGEEEGGRRHTQGDEPAASAVLVHMLGSFRDE